jgi:hypothetical protein
MPNEKKEGSVLGQIAVGIFVALVASGTAPWWVDKFFSQTVPSPTPSSSPTDSSIPPSPTPSPTNSSAPPLASPSPYVDFPVPKPPPATPTPVVTDSTFLPLDWNDTALNLSGRLDQDFTYTCPSGGRVGSVYGTDIYAATSSICSAAVHAGLITARDGGKVMIRIRPGEDSYSATNRNGVRSSKYGGRRGSFIFLK